MLKSYNRSDSFACQQAINDHTYQVDSRSPGDDLCCLIRSVTLSKYKDTH